MLGIHSMCRLGLAGIFMFVANGANATQDNGWRTLFNGEDLSGWEMVGPGEFKVEDGSLVTYGGMGLLYYEPEMIGDAEIRVVYQEMGEKDNSGVFIRIAVKPTTPWHAVNQGYEVQIDRHADSWHRTGVLYSMTEAMAEIPESEDGWNTMIIRLDGDRTVVTVNGAVITDFTEGDSVPPRSSITEPARGPRPRAGYIGLQNHDNNSRVAFRDISVRPLESSDGPE
jgi:hypothetical protein